MYSESQYMKKQKVEKIFLIIIHLKNTSLRVRAVTPVND